METRERDQVEPTGTAPAANGAAPPDEAGFHEAWEILKAASDRANEIDFTLASRRIDWSRRSAREFAAAVRLALAAAAHVTARELASKGVERFPADAELAKMARILSPPRFVGRSPGGDSAIQADTDWLRMHAGEHCGQWIALRNGELLATAPTLKELERRAGDIRGVLVTRLP